MIPDNVVDIKDKIGKNSKPSDMVLQITKDGEWFVVSMYGEPEKELFRSKDRYRLEAYATAIVASPKFIPIQILAAFTQFIDTSALRE